MQGGMAGNPQVAGWVQHERAHSKAGSSVKTQQLEQMQADLLQMRANMEESAQKQQQGLMEQQKGLATITELVEK